MSKRKQHTSDFKAKVALEVLTRVSMGLRTSPKRPGPSQSRHPLHTKHAQNHADPLIPAGLFSLTLPHPARACVRSARIARAGEYGDKTGKNRRRPETHWSPAGVRAGVMN